MSITRAPRPTSNFYLLDKVISEDRRLGWAARGLLVFLLGKPDHWMVSPAALVNETSDALRGTGRDGVYAILKELKDVGYLRITGNRNDGGVFSGCDYVVCELPHTEIPHTVDFPDTVDLPDTAQPDTANPTLVSIDLKQGLKKKQVLNTRAVAPVVARPDDIAQQLWADYLQIRKARKSPLTNTALDGLRREADKAGISLSGAITMCCERGWQSFKSDWIADKQNGKAAAITARNANKHAAAAAAIFGDDDNNDFDNARTINV
jgi:hypothetical protein